MQHACHMTSEERGFALLVHTDMCRRAAPADLQHLLHSYELAVITAVLAIVSGNTY